MDSIIGCEFVTKYVKVAIMDTHYNTLRVKVMDKIKIPHVETSVVREFDKELPMDALDSYEINSVTNKTAYLCKILDWKYDATRWASEVSYSDKFQEMIGNFSVIILEPDELNLI